MKVIGSYTLQNNSVTVNVYSDMPNDVEDIDDSKIISNLVLIGEQLMEKTDDELMVSYNNYFVVASIRKAGEKEYAAIVIAAGTEKNIIVDA